jgi:hypothetical protein
MLNSFQPSITCTREQIIRRRGYQVYAVTTIDDFKAEAAYSPVEVLGPA